MKVEVMSWDFGPEDIDRIEAAASSAGVGAEFYVVEGARVAYARGRERRDRERRIAAELASREEQELRARVWDANAAKMPTRVGWKTYGVKHGPRSRG